MGQAGPPLRSQRLRLVNHQGDALRLGMNWTEEDLAKPQVLVESAYGMGHPGTFHFRGLEEEVSNGVYEAGGNPGALTSVPAHLLAIARCDLPAIHLPGGAQLNRFSAVPLSP